MSSAQVAQLTSSFFKLPAELRIAIYELLDFPPVDNHQCRGVILSCRQAKHECEGVAIRMIKTWLAAFKKDVLPQSQPGLRILLPFDTRTPTSLHAKFHTLKDLTLVFPGHSIHGCAEQDQDFFKSFRPLNAIFCLWLDSLTLHFRGPLEPERGLVGNMSISHTFRRLFFVLESGLTFAHDPASQWKELKINKYRHLVKYWQPQPAFIRRLVVSWDVTKEGLRSEEMIGVDGICQKRPTAECHGLRYHHVVSEDGLLGQESRESDCRFRPSAREDWMARPKSEHKKKCFHCGCRSFDYRRYARGLPDNGDERWL